MEEDNITYENTQHYYWTSKKKETIDSINHLPNQDFTKELKDVYLRQLEIFEEIILDLSPELDDPQYTETTSWSYEEELKNLYEKQKELEPIVEDEINNLNHQEFLKDIGMTQKEYENHLKEIESKNKKFKK